MQRFKDFISELNRYEKETGKSTGRVPGRTGLNTPAAGTPTQKGGSGKSAVSNVKRMIRQMHGKPTGQQKKEKGAKSDAGTGKYKAMADIKRATAADAMRRVCTTSTENILMW